MPKSRLMVLIATVAIIAFALGFFVNERSYTPNILLEDKIDGSVSNWYTGGDKGGSVVSDPSFYVSPNSSLKITTSIGDNKLFYSERGISRPFAQKLGLDFWWQINSQAKDFNIMVNWYHFENGTIKQLCASILYDAEGNVWRYLNANGYYYNITNGVQKLPIAETAIWINTKIVVDFGAKEYVLLSTGGKTFNLQGLKLASLLSFGDERIDWRFAVTNRNSNFSAVLNIDDVRLVDQK